MEKREFVERLEALVNTEDILKVSKEANELRAQFEDFCLEKDRLKQVAILEAQEKGQTVEMTNEPDSIKEAFYAIFNEYREKRNHLTSERKIEQESNLRKKMSLIERLKTLIASEENIGAAVETYKEIHELWKAVGDIPREKRQDIQSEYSKLLESFFFNLKIYRELKEHDLKRNFQLKTEIVGKIDNILQADSIKNMEQQIKLFQNEFDELGPVPKDEWEGLKNLYWTAVKAVYQKITAHYEAKREEQKQNIEKKNQLLTLAITTVMSADQLADTKQWDQATQTLLKIQQDWKEVGAGTKKENEELWSLFRSECDAFFTKKKAFYQVIKDKYDIVAAKKVALIEQVKSVKDSTEWKATTDKIIRIQQDWKKLGSAGQRNEQKLWKEFRSSCDAFFEAKKHHFAKEDKENEANLKSKNALIAEIDAYEVSQDKQKVIQDLKDFSNRFNAIGKVPFKVKDSVYQSFKKTIDAHYTKIKLEGEEKEKVLFQAHLDTLKSNPNASKMLDKERRDLDQIIAKHQQEINQLENNLGFISKSKAGDALRKDVEHKINLSKNKIKELKSKIKLLTNE
jgi:hypothetical protein